MKELPPTDMHQWKQQQQDYDVILPASPLRGERGKKPLSDLRSRIPDLHNLEAGEAVDMTVAGYAARLSRYNKASVLPAEFKDSVAMVQLVFLEYKGGNFVNPRLPEEYHRSYTEQLNELLFLTEGRSSEYRLEFYKHALDPLFEHSRNNMGADATVQTIVYESLWKGNDEFYDSKRPPLHERFNNTIEKRRHGLLPALPFQPQERGR